MDTLIVARDLLVRCNASLLVNWREDDDGLTTTLVATLQDDGQAIEVHRKFDLAPNQGIVGKLLAANEMGEGREIIYAAIDPLQAIHRKFVGEFELATVAIIPCNPIGQFLGCTALYFPESTGMSFNEERAFAASNLLTLIMREQYGSQRRSTLMAVAQACANTYHDVSNDAFLARARIQDEFGSNANQWPRGLESVHTRLLSIDKMTDDLNVLLQEGLEPSTSKVDITKLVTNLDSSFKERFKMTGHTLNVNVEQSLRSQTNKSLLSRSISNLVDNAIHSLMAKFPKGGGEVVIEASSAASDVAIRVSDNGRGIDPAHLKSIWTLGFTTKTDARRSKWGLGLGQVKSYVESVGGRVELESDWGSGASFTVWIPKRGA